MKRRGRRDLSKAEESLWNAVAKTVKPLPGRVISAPEELSAPPQAQPAPPFHLAPDPALGSLPKMPKQSPLEAGDPGRIKQIARGKVDIDAVLDLHGMGQDEADRATSAFIARSVQQGRRVLLIITGKGSRQSDRGEGRGVLRKRFVHAMESGLYGSSIAAVRPAHQKHGGTGAFYVLLKARKSAVPNREAVTKALRAFSKPRRAP